MNTIKRSLGLLVLTANIVCLNAQNLTIQPIEVQKDGQTEIVVKLSGGTAMTALQFNLQLPAGVTANTSNATLSVATDGHTLSVQTLDSGDLLFVLYSMDLKAFKDGELLRIPVTAGNEAVEATGKLYTVRTATAEAVSHTCADAVFNVKVTNEATGIKETGRTKVPQKAYDLQGRRLSRSSKGINIVGGRKQIVK